MNKLVLFDGNSIMYRSFYALPLLAVEDGTYTNAIYGFCNMLFKAINEIKPTHIAVAFDVGKKTFRNDMFGDYKGTRKPMPAEMASQIEPLKDLLRAMNITIVEKFGFEADDIIGSLSKKFANTQVIIVTGDRDSYQLISDTCSVFFTKKGVSDVKIMDKKAFEEEYQFEPEGIVDLKSLQGDASDNIPGVPGIGEKIAMDLIRTYKSKDEVYKNLENIKPSIRSKLEAGKDYAELSYKLAKINTEMELDISIENLKLKFPFSQEVYNMMQKFKFTSLLKREELFEKEISKQEHKEIETEKLDTRKKLQNLVSNIEKNGYFVSYQDKNADFYFYTSPKQWFLNANADMLSLQAVEVFDALKPLYESSAIRKFFFDSKTARHALDEFGIEVGGKVEDLSILAHLVEGIPIKFVEDVVGIGCGDCPAYGLYLAYQNLLPRLSASGMEKLYNDVELPLSYVLYDMEKAGFKVDKQRAKQLGENYKAELSQLTKKIYSLAGEEFNINSSKQLAEVLFEKLNLPHGKKTSTSAEVLQEIEGAHEIVPVILRYRKVNKILSTYIDGLFPHIDSDDVVHTNFKQTLTTTGRLSSTDPNLQNIPVRSEESREVRSIYVARNNDSVLIDADYSQIELRLLAHFSEDPFFLEAFRNGYDIHSQTACQVFGVNKENVTSEMRRIAKVVNFGIIYGISDFGLANDLRISSREAHQFIESFYQKHPAVKEYMASAVAKAKETGRVSTILGRTRKMIDINSSNYMMRSRAERASQNMPLQGSASDIIKLAMIKVYNALTKGKYKAKLIMQVHDELIIDSPKEEVEDVKKLMKECMDTAIELKVPLVCDITTSYRWSDGH